jgi:hypothetical protein
VDTSVVIDLDDIDAAHLPREIAASALSDLVEIVPI